MRLKRPADDGCAIAQALAVVGDAWSLLIVREIAGGTRRFDALESALHVSRRTLTERLTWLVDANVVERQPYSTAPARFEYHLTRAGEALLPTLISLQDWGSRFVLGDGSITATTTAASPEARRVDALRDTQVPELALTAAGGRVGDPLSTGRWTVVFCFPGAYPPETGGYPSGWSQIPGAPGCTMELLTYQRRVAEFEAAGVDLAGVSTQRPDQLAAFTDYANLTLPLWSDQELILAAALRLPTFRASGLDRLKRLTLLVDPERRVRQLQYPIIDPAASVDEMLALAIRALGSRPASDGGNSPGNLQS